MAEEFIRQLSAVPKNTLPLEDQTCCICLLEYGCQRSEDDAVERPVRLPDCNHVVGSDCIVKWVASVTIGGHNICPFCRRILFPVQQDDDYGDTSESEDGDLITEGMSESSEGIRSYFEEGTIWRYISGDETPSPVAIAQLRNEDGSWREESLPLESTVINGHGFSIFQILEPGDFGINGIEQFHQRRATTPRIGAPATVWTPLVNQQFRRDEERIHYLAYVYPEVRQPPLTASQRGELSPEQLDRLFEELQRRGYLDRIWRRSHIGESAEQSNRGLSRPTMREVWDLVRDSGYFFFEREPPGVWVRVIWQPHDPVNPVEPSWLEWGEDMLQRSREDAAV